MPPRTAEATGARNRSLRWILASDGPNERSLQRRAALIRAAAVLAFLAAWQLTASAGLVDPLFVSTPARVAGAMVDLARSPGWWDAFGQTLSELLTAFVVGTLGGVAVGGAMALSRPLRDAYLGPIEFMLSVPKSVFVPFFILLFGLGMISAAAFGAFSAFFYVVVNLMGGIDLVEDHQRRVAYAYGAGRLQVLTDVVLPASLPGLFAALWQGVKHAFGGVLIAELWASRGGIGQLIELYTSQFRAGHVLAITLVVALLAILMGSLWTRMERAVDWRRFEQRQSARTAAG